MDKQALATINAYNPGLSAAWMFQRSMSVRPNHRTHPQFINRLLGVNFKSMQLRGDWVLKPFLQVRHILEGNATAVDVLCWKSLVCR